MIGPKMPAGIVKLASRELKLAGVPAVLSLASPRTWSQRRLPARIGSYRAVAPRVS